MKKKIVFIILVLMFVLSASAFAFEKIYTVKWKPDPLSLARWVTWENCKEVEHSVYGVITFWSKGQFFIIPPGYVLLIAEKR